VPAEESPGLIYDMVHVNVNVTDIRRSVAFYETIGFRVIHVFGDDKIGLDPTGDVMEGMSGGRTRGVVMSLGDHPRCFTKLELLEHVAPPTEPAHPRPMHAVGLARLAIRCKDLPAEVARLEAAGIAMEEIQETDIVGASRFVLFRDPDGALLELIEFPAG
jgi:catechol 2,3-dioxygenase-like lactoylglutathione lyase family enzyme